MVSKAERARRAKQAAAAKGEPPTARPKRDKAQILTGVRKTFQMVELGLGDLTGADPTRRLPGLRNVAVFGHATTQAIQNLRGVEPAFDEWYGAVQAEMRADPLMKYFWDLRSKILKEGTAGPTGNFAHIHHMNSADLEPLMKNPPPGAKGFFIGDAAGGNGWEIQLPDGTTMKYYVALPESISIDQGFRLEEPPSVHKGQPINDKSAAGLARLYVAELPQRVNEAQNAFRITTVPRWLATPIGRASHRPPARGSRSVTKHRAGVEAAEAFARAMGHATANQAPPILSFPCPAEQGFAGRSTASLGGRASWHESQLIERQRGLWTWNVPHTPQSTPDFRRLSAP